MDFTVGKGFEIKGGVASVPVGELSDAEALSSFEELKAELESRGLWVPEGVGQVAVVQTIVSPEDLRGQLLENAEADIEHTNRVFEIINDTRRKNKRFDIVSAGEQRERLEDQLTEKAITATGYLHTTEDRSLMVVPALPDAITAEELVTAIDKSSRRGIYPWAGRLPFLGKFPIDALTGYDEERAESGAMTLVETAYDISRQGTVREQLAGLREVQKSFPEVGTAPIITTASLGQRYNGQPNSWQDTHTRALEADPVPHDGFDRVVNAYLSVLGYSVVRDSDVLRENVSRRQVRLDA
jgi:hypothetical protein